MKKKVSALPQKSTELSVISQKTIEAASWSDLNLFIFANYAQLNILLHKQLVILDKLENNEKGSKSYQQRRHEKLSNVLNTLETNIQIATTQALEEAALMLGSLKITSKREQEIRARMAEFTKTILELKQEVSNPQAKVQVLAGINKMLENISSEEQLALTERLIEEKNVPRISLPKANTSSYFQIYQQYHTRKHSTYPYRHYLVANFKLFWQVRRASYEAIEQELAEGIYKMSYLLNRTKSLIHRVEQDSYKQIGYGSILKRMRRLLLKSPMPLKRIMVWQLFSGQELLKLRFQDKALKDLKSVYELTAGRYQESQNIMIALLGKRIKQIDNISTTRHTTLVKTARILTFLIEKLEAGADVIEQQKVLRNIYGLTTNYKKSFWMNEPEYRLVGIVLEKIKERSSWLLTSQTTAEYSQRLPQSQSLLVSYASYLQEKMKDAEILSSFIKDYYELLIAKVKDCVPPARAKRQAFVELFSAFVAKHTLKPNTRDYQRYFALGYMAIFVSTEKKPKEKSSLFEAAQDLYAIMESRNLASLPGKNILTPTVEAGLKEWVKDNKLQYASLSKKEKECLLELLITDHEVEKHTRRLKVMARLATI